MQLTRCRHFLGISAFLCILLPAGCNDEVFIEGPVLPHMTEVTVEGDGGETSFKATLDKLTKLDISLKQWIKPSRLICFNAYGDTVSPDSPPSEISRMVYEADICRIELDREGSLFSVRSLSNAAGQDLTWTIGLCYDFGMKSVQVTALPGKPLKLLDVSYGGIFEAEGFSEPMRRHFDNQGHDTPWEATMQPFLNQRALINVEPAVSWLYGSTVRMPLPVCDGDGVWSFSKDTSEVKLGGSTRYDGPDRNTEVPVTVPPQFKGTAETAVLIARAETSGLIRLLNQALGTQFDIPFTATVSYPFSYTPVSLIPD